MLDVDEKGAAVRRFGYAGDLAILRADQESPQLRPLRCCNECLGLLVAPITSVLVIVRGPPSPTPPGSAASSMQLVTSV